jgi:hypothetical protein
MRRRDHLPERRKEKNQKYKTITITASDDGCKALFDPIRKSLVEMWRKSYGQARFISDYSP